MDEGVPQILSVEFGSPPLPLHLEILSSTRSSQLSRWGQGPRGCGGFTHNEQKPSGLKWTRTKWVLDI